MIGHRSCGRQGQMSQTGGCGVVDNCLSQPAVLVWEWRIEMGFVPSVPLLSILNISVSVVQRSAHECLKERIARCSLRCPVDRFDPFRVGANSSIPAKPNPQA